MASVEGFLTAVVINTVVGAVAFLVFCCIRRKHPNIYEPRLRYGDRKPPKPMSAGFFSWIKDVIDVTDEELYESAGVDSLVYTLYFRYGLEVMLFCSFFGIFVLVPINATSHNRVCVDGVCNSQFGLDLLSLSNIPEQSSRLWAHLVCMYLFSAFAIWRLKTYYLIYIKYRNKFLAEGGNHQFSVLVRDIPPELQTSEALTAKFAELYPDQVDAARVAHGSKALNALVAERKKIGRQVEHTEAVLAINAAKGKEDKRPQQRIGGFICCGGEKVDKQEYLAKKLPELNEAVINEQLNCENHPSWASAGFVTFRSVKAANVCAQTTQTATPVELSVQSAPEPRDVYWPNLFMPFWQRTVRTILFTAATYWLVIFWIIPVAFVATLTTLDSLCDSVDFICTIVNASPVLANFLEGFLPGLALLIFMAILPMILSFFSRMEGIPAESWIEHSMLKKYYIFQVFNVFFISLIAGSAFDAISDIIDSPTSIINLLGNAIPSTGIFFTTYVMLLALSKFPLQLLQIGRLIVSWLKLKFLAKTTREKWEAQMPGPFGYGREIPQQLLVTLLGLTYAVANPLILPFVVIFFSVGYFVARYTHMWVYVPRYESGGLMWPTIHNRIMGAVILHQVAMLGIFGVKRGPVQAGLVFPLIFATVICWRHFTREYADLAAFLPRNEMPTETEAEPDNEAYLWPPLRAPEDLPVCPWDADPEADDTQEYLAIHSFREPAKDRKATEIITPV